MNKGKDMKTKAKSTRPTKKERKRLARLRNERLELAMRAYRATYPAERFAP